MDIDPQKIAIVTGIGVAGCLALNYLIIEPLNHWWSRRHPAKTRHPFSPAFTALGVLWVLAQCALLLPVEGVLIVLGGFVVNGGTMWILHGVRWRRRNQGVPR